MPAVAISASDLVSLLGRSLEGEELRSAVLGCKAEVEDVEGDEIRLEVKDSNRIDLLSVEGIARTLKGYLGTKKGLEKYVSRPSGIRIRVDSSVRKVRPYVVACCARNARLTDAILASYMNFQEKIHTTYGRGRRRMAIGFYDLELISPPIRYTLTKPDENAFIPLGSEEPMTPRQILMSHPKGREFAHLLRGHGRYPMLLDSRNQVLSMPPIINSNTPGKVTSETTNLFVEATGSDFDVLSLGLNVLATALSDRGCETGSVEISYGTKDIRITPDFSTSQRKLHPGRCKGTLGLSIGSREMVDLLKRARFGARISRGLILVQVPCYRGDIMHESDLIEEIAIMYGYGRMVPIRPRIPTTGRTDELEDFSDTIRELMIGLGFQEIMTFVLTSPQNVSGNMRNRQMSFVEVENPSTETFSIFRPDLLPSVLEFLGHNAHVAYPQLVFEVGDAVELADGRCTTIRKACLAWADSRVNVTQIRGTVESLLSSLGCQVRVEPATAPPFIEGRGASVVLDDDHVGIFGEIHPEVLTSWQIPVPVLAAELKVLPIYNAVRKSSRSSGCTPRCASP